MEAVPPHVLLGADVVLHLQARLENGLLLRRPAEPGEPLVKGAESCRRGGGRDPVDLLKVAEKTSESSLLGVFFRPCMST